MRATDIASLELWVGNARQASSYLSHAFGFSLVGTTAGQDRVTYLLEQGSARVNVTGATDRDSPVAAWVRAHGDGVRDIALSVRGRPDDAPIAAFGDTVHSLLDAPAVGDVDPVNPTPATAAGPGAPPPVGLVAVDHIAVSVEAGDREACVRRYERDLGFERFGPATQDVDLGESAFVMSSVRAREGSATLVFAEPGAGPSQIADFLRENGGAGVHHVAFATADIVATAAALHSRSVSTLHVPDTYYARARERFADHDLPWDELQQLGVLVDSDQHGLLLQAFTDPIGDRSTLYFEIIQRAGATGFGTENVRALYHAVVLRTPRG